MASQYLFGAAGHQSLAPGETEWLLQNGMKVQTPIALTIPQLLPR